MPRHDFSVPDKQLLAERVGFHCSNPSCGVGTIGPSDVPNKKEYVGVAAHIYSASINKGPRANPDLTKDERCSLKNGIHLCNKCSTLIDKNKGVGYPAEILVGWKLSAEAAAKNRIYKSNSYTLVKKVNFSNLEKKYSTALTCSGLNNKNVVSCPANKPIIANVSNKLRLAYKCILKGESGSGKSLLTYQTAYEFYNKGWSIFDLNKELLSDNTVLVAPQERSLIIIDDAQTINSRHLENILDSSYDDCTILINWNSSTSFESNFLKNYPCVDVIASSQVELLKSYCLENKNSITVLLKSIGIKINNKDYQSRIETRIEKASHERTPWLFNYHLTEGWNGANNDLSLLKDDDHMDLVIVTVAAYQLATLDYGVNQEVIFSSLKDFCDTPLWLTKVDNVLKEYCQIKDNLIKNKHYEYSRKVLKIFSSQKDIKEEKLYLIGVFKKILMSPFYEKGHSNVLEFIMFNFRWCQFELNETGFIDEVTDQLLSDNEDVSPSKIAKLNSLIRFNKNVLSLLELNKPVIEKWMFGCCRDTAYSLGSLSNTLYNEKYLYFPSSKELVDLLLDKTISCNIDDKSRFSYMLNRMYMLLSDDDRIYAREQLLNTDFNVDISCYSTDTACYQFSSLIYHLAYINDDWANQQVKNNVDGIARLLNQNLMEAYREFKDLIDSYFGVIPAILGIKNTNSELAKRGKELSNKIQVEAILKGFETVEAIDVQDYSNIIIFMALYNRTKLKQVSERFDYARLESLYEGDFKMDHYHRGLIAILYNPNSDNYMRYLSKVIISNNYIDELFIELSPDLSLVQLKRGVKYKMTFHDGSECKKELLILKYLMREESKTLVERMLFENEEEFTKSIFSESQNVDNKKGKFDLLLFIQSDFPELFRRIFNDNDKNIKLLEKIPRLLRGKINEKNIARLYVYLVKEYAGNTPLEVIGLEKKYPSIRRFDISLYRLS